MTRAVYQHNTFMVYLYMKKQNEIHELLLVKRFICFTILCGISLEILANHLAHIITILVMM